MKGIYKVESDINHGVAPSLPAGLYKGGLFSKRYVSLTSLFNICITDDVTNYILKDSYTDKSYWCTDETLGRLYKYNSINLNFKFRSSDIPKRCERTLLELTKVLIVKLSKTRSRVSKSKAKVTVKLLLKNISRLQHHKKYTIRYTTSDTIWKDLGENASQTYMLELLTLLQEQGNIYMLRGYVDHNDRNICSMFIVTPNFIRYCNSNRVEKQMDACLRERLPNLLEIRDDNKNPRNPRRDELMAIEDANKILEAYTQGLEKRTIVINGIEIPEIFFRRIHNIDLEHGGRFYDKGQIQGEDAVSRSSVLIDGMPTVELDYASLHYAIAAEELGVDLQGKDPYDFHFDIDVDWDVVNYWKHTYGFTANYNPVRNLKKMVLLTLFNANSLKEAQQGISKSILDDYRKEEPVKRKFVGLNNVPVKKLVKALLAANKEVSSYMHSGVGSRFQKIDSSMIEFCIKGLMDIGEIALPVHDSLIVREDLKKHTTKLMEDAYEYVMGSKLNCKIK